MDGLSRDRYPGDWDAEKAAEAAEREFETRFLPELASLLRVTEAELLTICDPGELFNREMTAEKAAAAALEEVQGMRNAVDEFYALHPTPEESDEVIAELAEDFGVDSERLGLELIPF